MVVLDAHRWRLPHTCTRTCMRAACTRVRTVVLEMSNTGNKVPNTGNAHYLPVLEYRGYSATLTPTAAHGIKTVRFTVKCRPLVPLALRRR